MDRSHDGKNNTAYHVGVYLAPPLVMVGAVCNLQPLVYSAIGIRASTTLFQKMVHASLSALLRWICNTSKGRYLTPSKKTCTW